MRENASPSTPNFIAAPRDAKRATQFARSNSLGGRGHGGERPRDIPRQQDAGGKNRNQRRHRAVLDDGEKRIRVSLHPLHDGVRLVGFSVPDFTNDPSNPVHGFPSFVRANDFRRGLKTFVAPADNGPLHFAEFIIDHRLQACNSSHAVSVAMAEALELLEQVVGQFFAVVVRFQIALRASDEEAALAGLGILDAREEAFQLESNHVAELPFLGVNQKLARARESTSANHKRMAMTAAKTVMIFLLIVQFMSGRSRGG